MKNVAIIMAGGKGERFWPMSTSKRPKQFLSLTESNKTMIQLTIDRIAPLVNLEDIYVVTNKNYKDVIKDQIPQIKEENILYEPVGKNTAPCIAYATMVIKKRYDDANVIVLSSDHVIKNINLFLDNIKLGIKKLTDNNIITIGIVPTRPETGYGYIKIGTKDNIDLIYDVEKFVEKPNYDLAKEYYESSNYLWNSGMFMWKNSFMDECIKTYLPKAYKNMLKIYKAVDTDSFYDVVKEEFEKIEAISIDYAVLEKVDNILVIPGSFGWDDVGSWLAVERLKTLDKYENIIEGKVISIDSSNNIILNNDYDTLLVTSGLSNLVIVKSDDVILIINKDNVPDIKQVIEKVKESKENERYL